MPESIAGSDITALAKDKIYTHINLEEMSIHQVLCREFNLNIYF